MAMLSVGLRNAIVFVDCPCSCASGCNEFSFNAVWFSDRRLFAEDYDAVSEARDADDWLTHKLRKVKSKRDIDPDQMRRRNQEKMLLEVRLILQFTVHF